MQAALIIVLCAVTAFNLAQCAFVPIFRNINLENNPLTDYLNKKILNKPEFQRLKESLTKKYPSCEARKLELASCRIPDRIEFFIGSKLETKKQAERRCAFIKAEMEKACALEKVVPSSS